MLRKLLACGTSITLVILLSSCYRIPVPQGNVISAETAQRIRPGMSEYDVTAILGSPVLNNTYSNNQMAYVYTMKKGIHEMKVKRLIIYFKNNTVAHIESDYEPAAAALPEPD